MERTFAMIKPDGVQRGLVGPIVARYEAKGLKLVGMKLLQVSRSQAEAHYIEHVGKPFYEGLIDFIMSGPVVALVYTGKNAVGEVRKINGKTNPADALPGTIRGDYGQDVGRNIVHGSDGVESAAREIDIYFTPDELLTYDHLPAPWLFE